MVLRCAKDSVRNMLPTNTDTDLVKLKDKSDTQIRSIYEEDSRFLNSISGEINKSKGELIS